MAWIAKNPQSFELKIGNKGDIEMKTINKVVGNLRVFACQIQENLVSCTAQYNTELNCPSPKLKEIIFKTSNVEGALNKYIEMLKIGNKGVIK